MLAQMGPSLVTYTLDRIFIARNRSSLNSTKVTATVEDVLVRGVRASAYTAACPERDGLRNVSDSVDAFCF